MNRKRQTSEVVHLRTSLTPHVSHYQLFRKGSIRQCRHDMSDARRYRPDPSPMLADFRNVAAPARQGRNGTFLLFGPGL